MPTPSPKGDCVPRACSGEGLAMPRGNLEGCSAGAMPFGAQPSLCSAKVIAAQGMPTAFDTATASRKALARPQAPCRARGFLETRALRARGFLETLV